MPRLTREQIRTQGLRAEALFREVEVPELGGSLVVRAVTLEERNRARQQAVTNPDTNEMDVARFQHYLLLEGSVEPRFDIEDLGVIAAWPSGVSDRLVNVIYELSGMTPAKKAP